MTKRAMNKTVRRVISGVRVAFHYDARKLDVTVTPDCDDLRTCPPASLLRFWAAIAHWAKGVPGSSPGWTVNGGRPEPDPDRDVPPEPDDDVQLSTAGTGG